MPIVGSFAGASARAYGLGAGVLVGDFESIQTVTVGSGGAANIEFTSIPSTYTHLQIRGLLQATYNATDYDNIIIRFNSDSGSNYSFHYVSGNGSTASSGSGATQTRGLLFATTLVSSTNSIFGVVVIDILDYANTNKYKTMRSIGGADLNGSGVASLSSSNWRSTNAITSVTLSNANGNWKQYSSLALYGIKG
jgi:hypothetical protein